jgi:penicillin G amidase
MKYLDCFTIVSSMGTLALLIISIILFFILKTNHVPIIEGELKIEGLYEKVEILREKNGLIHINANNEHDLFMSFGVISGYFIIIKK